jgi:hypothetical protein
MVKKRKKMMVALTGVAIAALSFTADKIVGEHLKAEYDDLKSVEKDFTDALGPETFQYQFLALQQILQKREVDLEKKKPEVEQDYSNEIQEDQISIRNFVSMLSVSITSTTALLKRIDARTRDLQATLVVIRPQIQKVIDNATAATEPSDAHDWDRAIAVKIELVMVGIERIQVMVIAADGISRVEREQERVKELEDDCTYLGWGLGLFGFSIAAYGIATGLGSE